MQIEFLGTSFTVRTDEDPEYFRAVLEHFRKKVNEVERSVSTADPLKIAILAGILASDDFLKLTGEHRREESTARTITDSLIAELEDALDARDQ